MVKANVPSLVQAFFVSKALYGTTKTGDFLEVEVKKEEKRDAVPKVAIHVKAVGNSTAKVLMQAVGLALEDEGRIVIVGDNGLVCLETIVEAKTFGNEGLDCIGNFSGH